MKYFLSLIFSLSLAWNGAHAQTSGEFKNGVVVSVSAPGSEAGLSILKKEGNAVDAAVATAFALAVTHPAAGNIGGGGFMNIFPPKGDPVIIDYREVAPAAAHKTIFKKGESNLGHRVVGVPGTVRGLSLAHQKFGALPWKTLLLPAIQLAKEGFILDAHHANSLNGILASSKNFGELQRVFAKPEGGSWKAGDRLIQTDLSKTLQTIADLGPDAFYQGPIADQLITEMKSGNGLINQEDLAKFQALARKPIIGKYRGHRIIAPPPPSAGGTCLVQMLHVLENFDLKKQDRYSPETLHLLAETMRRSYADRARFIGDPAFTKIPGHLLQLDYAKKLAQSIDEKKATPSEELAKDIPLTLESDSTTHFSVLDRSGLAVSNTYTLEQSYGSRIVVKGAGFLLNNEMLDFNWFPGITNRKGGIGTEPNQIAPGKKMLSSQTPAIVTKDGKVLLITGSPGGRTITNTVLNVVINLIDYEMEIQDAVNAPRIHHAWFPDEIRFEGVKEHPDAVQGLKKRGHRVEFSKQGDAHSIWVNPQTGGFVGAADKRLSGKVSGY